MDFKNIVYVLLSIFLLDIIRINYISFNDSKKENYAQEDKLTNIDVNENNNYIKFKNDDNPNINYQDKESTNILDYVDNLNTVKILYCSS